MLSGINLVQHDQAILVVLLIGGLWLVHVSEDANQVVVKLKLPVLVFAGCFKRLNFELNFILRSI